MAPDVGLDLCTDIDRKHVALKWGSLGPISLISKNFEALLRCPVNCLKFWVYYIGGGFVPSFRKRTGFTRESGFTREAWDNLSITIQVLKETTNNMVYLVTLGLNATCEWASILALPTFMSGSLCDETLSITAKQSRARACFIAISKRVSILRGTN